MTLNTISDLFGRSDRWANADAAIDRDVAQLEYDSRAADSCLGDHDECSGFTAGDQSPHRALHHDASCATHTERPRSNHEFIAERSLWGLTVIDDGRMPGEIGTTLTYGVNARAPLSGRAIIRGRDLVKRLSVSHLRSMFAPGNVRRPGLYCFVDVEIGSTIPVAKRRITNLARIRENFLRFAGNFGCAVAPRHMPVRVIDFPPDRTNLDIGAYATKRLPFVGIDAESLIVGEGAPR